MFSLCIRSSRLFLRTLVNLKTCVHLPPVRQIGRVRASAERLRGLTRLVGVSSCVALGAGLAFYNSDVIKLHAKTAEGGPRTPNQWNFIADVVEKVSPAVVYIEIEGRYALIGPNTVYFCQCIFQSVLYYCLQIYSQI